MLTFSDPDQAFRQITPCKVNPVQFMSKPNILTTSQDARQLIRF